jgi:hypothetical protein
MVNYSMKNKVIRKDRFMMNLRFKNMAFSKLLGFVILLYFFSQCQSNNQSKTAANGKIDTALFSGESDSVRSDSLLADKIVKPDSFSSINFLLPAPDEILAEIIPARAEFNFQLVNSRNNATKYVNTKSQALNLGVYLTDFAYLNLNDKKNEALAYFKTIRDLAQKVNIYGLFSESVYNRIQNNLTNRDTLSEISKELYYKMLDVLESSKRNNIYALAASGALIEALYLSTMVVNKYSDYQIVAQKIFEQKYVLTNFFEFASQFDKDKDVKAVLIQVNELKKILEGSAGKKTEKNVKMDSKDHMVIGGGEEIIVSEESFKNFKQNVIKTRQEIISITNK